MAVDFNVLCFDPAFEVLGVPATLIAASTAGEIALTVIDETRVKTTFSGNIAMSGVGPTAAARVPELTANGITRDDYDGSTLIFNGRTWTVRKHEMLGSPNGEDLGLVRFLLKANND
jgi:hypothetical protein